MDARELGMRIKAARQARGETQMVMAAKFGVMQQNISGYERGKRPVPPRFFKRLAREYKVKFEDEAVKPELSTVAEQGERRLQAPDRRNDKLIRCIPIVERMFIEELKNFLDAVTVALCGTVRRRRGGIVRGRRLRT